jgi:hypothetical protein
MELVEEKHPASWHLECLAIHRFRPTKNRVKAAKQRRKSMLIKVALARDDSFYSPPMTRA